jgi:hypothetical protein
MSVFDDLIRFDLLENWELTISASRTAVQPTPDTHSPIETFTLVTGLTTPYVAIIVQTTQGKITWHWGGEVRQSWNFPSGASLGSLTSIAQSQPSPLYLNRLQLIGLNPNSLEPYSLRYTPPKWFKDVIVYGWKYTGTVENFVADTLFDIGNQVGIGTLNLPNNIPNTLNAMNQRLIRIEALLGSSQSISSNPLNTVSPNEFEDYNNLGLL